ncbi:iron-sulfur cluster co-chaperone protein HscB [Schistocerca piceifrons]|uniref:iron-sulfur cluster co-chaperone protein HscB n=1 Tax=Schistocerca piceifrons TaxID=274613 RepID=UPI001F5F895E|nr:iron-sulfur cluster co-chaperone protein HscB [Schistocerca piceifrons]XP_047118202.1 iron-sulfur cluster co-chaperone protein HscB [Schistocerca piceifrons]
MFMMSLSRLGLRLSAKYYHRAKAHDLKCVSAIKCPKLLSSVVRHMSEVSRKCWKCGSEQAQIFCHSCNTIQQPDDKSNYFEVIGVTPSYDLDTVELTTKYRQLQNVLHPDRFANRTKEERMLSEDYSSLVNKAYSTLQQPLSRGLYMLQLQGSEISESTQHSDPEFLMEIMELNESVEMASSAAELNVIEEQNKETLQQLSRDLSSSFAEGDMEKAKRILVRMKYYSTAESKIKEKRQEFGFE